MQRLVGNSGCDVLPSASTGSSSIAGCHPLLTDHCLLLTAYFLLLTVPQLGLAQSAPLSVSELADLARPSVTVVAHHDRDGAEDGVGAGFVISSDGLIATALHVIGEARRVTLRVAGGAELEATGIHAWDRKLDLAVIRVRATDLPALELGDSATLSQGDSVVAMGNPLGLEHSIVEGVVSAIREVDDQQLIQLAIPIEPGNSGGPLLDRQGRVQGIINMKSALTPNLGFAIPVNLLKPMLAKPNPVAMDRWMTIGTLPRSQWQPMFGARWSQKAGHIHVERPGNGFGGRSLCLAQQTVPEPPYEIAVQVRLKNEDGAAGLLFSSDGDQKHYGFYPSAGRLRLTRFDGPDVFSWTILDQVDSPHYRPNTWNWLKVRREPDRILCYVNDQLVIESPDRGLAEGQIGLAKFRNTIADFKNFQLGVSLKPPDELPAPDTTERLIEQIDGVAAGLSVDLETLAGHPEAARELLDNRLKELEKQTERIKQTADHVHALSVRRKLADLLDAGEQQIDLFAAALLVAKLDNPDLVTQVYQDQIDAMAEEMLRALPNDASEQDRLDALRGYLFIENGFHGSRSDYYNRANSYMNEVLDDREGLPITLSVLFMELGHRIQLHTLAGIGLPGHFVVRHQPTDSKQPAQLLDVFDGAKTMSREEATERVFATTGRGFRPEHLDPVTKREIILRMLENLLSIAQTSGTTQESLRYLDTIIEIDPENAMKRGLRAMLRLRNNDTPGAKHDLEWILERSPEGIDLDRINQFYNSL